MYICVRAYVCTIDITCFLMNDHRVAPSVLRL